MSTSPDCNFTSERSKQRITRILEALKDGGLTRAQICKKAFMSNTAGCLYITQMKKSPRLIYTADWQGNTPIYALGDKPDVPIKKHTRKQLHRKMKKNQPEKHAKNLEKQRLKYWEERDATKLVGIDRRNPPLATQIENYVIVNRHKTTGQVAKALDAKATSVSTILKRLAKDGKVRPVTLGDTRFKWESALHDPIWPALEIAKQNPWSALGL